MSFLEQIKAYEGFDFKAAFDSVTPGDILGSINNTRPGPQDLIHLLAPGAQDFLEEMAVKARDMTCQYFGRTIGLYAPLYISDFCSNHCTYCGFNTARAFDRKRLTLDEIDQEALAIAETGIRHVLVLTGEAPAVTSIDYLAEAVRRLKRYFASIALEMFPMDEADYSVLIRAGADSLTVYQEVYDRGIYGKVHPRGKKADYDWRLLTPERGGRAGFRALNIGTLFGLGEPRSEAFMAGLHALFLERQFPHVEISLSLPRMTRAGGGIPPRYPLSDKGLVQFMLAWRLCMPRLGINMSTREPADLRDRLIHLGVTRISAGSRTDVGGYMVRPRKAQAQFDVTDIRSVEQVAAMIRKSGYQPVFKDWEMPV